MIARLTTVYTAIFAAVLACISFYAYWLIGGQYRSLLAPALDTPEGQSGYRTAMSHVLVTIVAADVPVLIVVGLPMPPTSCVRRSRPSRPSRRRPASRPIRRRASSSTRSRGPRSMRAR